MLTFTDPAARDELLSAARSAALVAYCPYSHFRVGAALLVCGRIITGCNIENASYGLTLCAERVAVFTAIAAGLRDIEAIAVTCLDARADDPPDFRMPCGACRQVLAEFCGLDLPVLIDGVGEVQLGDLLPRPFRVRDVPGT